MEYSWESEFGDVFRGRRVLVTGATGFIGWHLCNALVVLGADIFGLSRSAGANSLPEGCNAASVDIRDYDAVLEAFSSRLKPEIIFHLAAKVTAQRDLSLVIPTLQHNLEGTVNLLLAAVLTGSTCFVSVGSSEENYGDNYAEVPSSPYAAAKKAASLYVKMFYELYGLPVTLIRPFLVYGPRQEESKVIPYTILSLLRGTPPRLSSGKRKCDFIFVLDVVRGLLKAASLCEKAKGEAVELATGDTNTIRDVVGLIVELTDTKIKPEFGTIRDRIGEAFCHPDCKKADLLLGWTPLWSLHDGLAETVRWYKENCNNCDD